MCYNIYTHNIIIFHIHSHLCLGVPLIEIRPLLPLLLLSAIIEHTNRVVYLEDDDVAAVNNEGSKCLFNFQKICDIIIIVVVLTIHHVKRDTGSVATGTERKVHTLKMKLQEIMKGP